MEAPRNTILQGDALAMLKTLPDECVQCVVTSPPYWGLRDYGISGQIGLEETPSAHVARIVQIFTEVRRVLRRDGTAWVNLGDTYFADSPIRDKSEQRFTDESPPKRSAGGARRGCASVEGLKRKDLVGMPWRIAFALQDSGWYLRADIVWHKSNPMPESATDRPTKAHEYLFLLSKRPNYFYDAAAIREAVTGSAHARTAGRNSRKYVDRDLRHIKMPDGWDTGKGAHGSFHRQGREKGRTVERKPGVTPKSARPGIGIRANESFHAAVVDLVYSRNKRSVWTVATHPFPEAHFATFPPALIEPCILAGSRPGDLVLDPFMGSGTTAIVAAKHLRDYLGIELNADYIAMANRRLERVQTSFLSLVV